MWKNQRVAVVAIIVFIIAAILSKPTLAAVAGGVAIVALFDLHKHLMSKLRAHPRPSGEGFAAGRDDAATHNVDRLLGSGASQEGSFCPKKKEGFLDSPLPGPRPPYPVAVAADGAADDAADDAEGTASAYPGAIETDGGDLDGDAGPAFDGGPSQGDRSDSAADGIWTRNHPDRREGASASSPEGNPFELSRVDAPKAAPPGVDDEADADDLDGDEAMTYQGRARNDATRVTAGTMNRRTDLDKYLREEVEERENIPWWGQHEL